jgi:hypothetical protein
MRFNAAGNEAQLILLPTRLLKEHDIPFGDALPPDTGSARQRVDDYVREVEHRAAFDEGVAGYHGKAGTREQDARSSFRATGRTLAYALMLAGLGFLGLMSCRRKGASR